MLLCIHPTLLPQAGCVRQGQFLSRVWLVWIQNSSSHRLVAMSRLEGPVCSSSWYIPCMCWLNKMHTIYLSLLCNETEFVKLYIYIYIHIHAYIFLKLYIYIYMYVYIWEIIYVYIIYTSIHTYIICTNTYIFLKLYIYSTEFPLVQLIDINKKSLHIVYPTMM